MKNFLKKFLKESSGLATLEFAILFLPFFLLLMVLLESMILIYQLALIDYVGANAARYASRSEPTLGYQKQFETAIKKHKNLLLFVDIDKSIKTSFEFCRNISELQNNNCTGSQEQNKLVVYTLTYSLSPIFRILRIFQIPENFVSKAIFYSEKTDYKDSKL